MAHRPRLRTGLFLLALSGVLVGLTIWRSEPTGQNGTLFYHSLHFAGGSLGSQEIRSIDLTSGRERRVSASGICSEISQAVDPSGHLITACHYHRRSTTNGFSILDLATGRERPVGSEDRRFPAGWTPDGALLLIEQHQDRHEVYSLRGPNELPEERPDAVRARRLYTTNRWVGATIGMRKDTVAVSQSATSVSACLRGGCHGGEIVVVRRGRILVTIPDSSGPVVAFGGGDRLLYMHGRQDPELRVLSFARQRVRHRGHRYPWSVRERRGRCGHRGSRWTDRPCR